MRKNRIGALLFVSAIVITVGLAVASPARAEYPIVRLVSVQNGMCLQPVNGSLNQGDAIVQAPCNGSLAQQWTDEPVSWTSTHLVNRASHLCLNARGGARNGTPIQQWTCNWISNQKWNFGITNNLLGSNVSGTGSHCIATPGGQAGLPMELRFCDGNAAQLWNRPPG